MAVVLMVGGSAEAVAPAADIPVPSGAKVWWLDTIQNVPGPAGVTFRYRFVMPDLARLVPATEGTATEELTPEDQAELDRLGTADAPGAPTAAATPAGAPGMDMAPAGDAGISLDGSGDAGGIAASDLVSPEELNLPDFRPEDFAEGAEAAADAAAASTVAGPGAGPAGPVTGSPADPAPLPPEPDLMLQDPVHEDIVWLCEHWVLPRLAAPSPLPGQVIISVADRPTTFGEVSMDAVQLFEAFSISADRKSCTWEAW